MKKLPPFEGNTKEAYFFQIAMIFYKKIKMVINKRNSLITRFCQASSWFQ